jgi:hypothetical protein
MVFAMDRMAAGDAHRMSFEECRKELLPRPQGSGSEALHHLTRSKRSGSWDTSHREPHYV